MKTFIVSVLLLCAVLTFIVFNTTYICSRSDEMLETVDSLPQSKEDLKRTFPLRLKNPKAVGFMGQDDR